MIDTHAHLNLPELYPQWKELVKEADLGGVSKVVVPGTTVDSSVLAVEIAERADTIFAAVGVHPCHQEDYNDQGREKLKELLVGTNSVVSIGEVGLDYYHLPADADLNVQEKIKNEQQELFKEMISYAKEFNLPLIIHSREAFTDTYKILTEQGAGVSTVLHCFTGSLSEAQQWLELGCRLSFTNIITYPKNQALRETIAQLPLKKLMVETDSPYLPPQARRGEYCRPSDLHFVVECLAEIYHLSLEEVDRLTTQNAEQFFGI